MALSRSTVSRRLDINRSELIIHEIGDHTELASTPHPVPARTERQPSPPGSASLWSNVNWVTMAGRQRCHQGRDQNEREVRRTLTVGSKATCPGGARRQATDQPTALHSGMIGEQCQQTTPSNRSPACMFPVMSPEFVLFLAPTFAGNTYETCMHPFPEPVIPACCCCCCFTWNGVEPSQDCYVRLSKPGQCVHACIVHTDAVGWRHAVADCRAD